MKVHNGFKMRKMDLNEHNENGNGNMSDAMMDDNDGENVYFLNEDNSGTTSHFKNVIESGIFTGNNIYLLAFASVAMVVTVIITVCRQRQQKFAAEQKEMEYLRYFHSVLPHSQIYGNLSEKFSKLDKRKNSRNAKRNSLRRKTDKVDDISDTENKLNGLTAIYKEFRYSQYSSKTLSKDMDNDEGNGLNETEMINIELKPKTAAFNKNGLVTPIAADDINEANTEKVCQKFHFAVETDNMQDISVQIEETENETIYKETELTENVRHRFDEKNAHKNKTESANHRVHFCLEHDENKQEKEAKLTDDESNASIGTPTQVMLHTANSMSNKDELIIKKLLIESIEDMKVTEL